MRSLSALRGLTVAAALLRWIHRRVARASDGALRRRLDAVAGARVLHATETAPEDFLPGDGHPTAAGNRRFARSIADALGRE